jgi:hypothetical protein
MPDPVNTVITDVSKVEQALENVVKPSDDQHLSDITKGTALPVLNTAKQLIDVLYGASSDVKSVGNDMAKALDEAAKILKSVADVLKTINNTGGTVTQALQSLQNALATAQAIIPGSPPALTAGSQFFGQITTLLTAASGDVVAASKVLYKFAQQLEGLSVALKPP